MFLFLILIFDGVKFFISVLILIVKVLLLELLVLYFVDKLIFFVFGKNFIYVMVNYVKM